MEETRITHPQIVEFITTTPWAILPAKLNTIMSVIEAKMLGEDIRAAFEKPIQREFREPYAVVDGVAVVPVMGTLLPRAGGLMAMSGLSSLQTIQSAIAEALADRSVNSILLEIDSPGGSVAGIPELAQMIFDARGEKPIHAIANTLMASAAYYLGSQADSISVAPSSQVGSIGVIMAHFDESKMWAQRGVKVSYITAGKYKAEGARTEPLSSEARAYLQSQVDATYDQFIEAVARGRSLSAEHVRKNFGEGRVFRAAQALEVGMVDRIETIHEAVERLSGKFQSHSVSAEPVRVAAQAFSESAAPWQSIVISDSTMTTHAEPPTSLKLRVPSEDRPRAGEDHRGGDDMAENTAHVTVGLSEDAQAEIEQLRAEIAAVSQERDQYAEATNQLTDRVGKLESERLRTKFTNIAMGHGGESDGLRFFGDVEAHVNLLLSMSDAFGEDSPEVAAYIDQQHKVAAAMSESQLFEAQGDSREPVIGANAYDRFMGFVADEQKQAAEKGSPISEEQAIEIAARKHPQAYRAYAREGAQRV